MLKIRLMRVGAKKKPFYRVVVVDERTKRTGSFIELLGTYNPLTEPKDINLKQDRIDHWIKQGAQMSVGYLRIIGKAPQRKPRKAKKAAKETPTTAPQAEEASQASETPAETPSESAPTPESSQPVEPAPTEQPSSPSESSTEPVATEQPKDTSEVSESEKKDEGSA